MAEMEAGVDVYYDRRWGATAILTNWLGEHRELFEGKKVLALGVGVGEESLLLGKYGKHIWLNDLAPVSLELCAEQMEENGLSNFTSLVGRYEQLDLPQVDLVVGGFLIYNEETCAAMEAFLKEHQGSGDFGERALGSISRVSRNGTSMRLSLTTRVGRWGFC